jgi:predicted nucleic acid-binding protein
VDAGGSLTVTYLDTSALMRLVTGKGDVAPVERSMSFQPSTSTLTELELLSAIYRRWREGAEAEANRDELLQAVERRISPALTLLPLTDDVLREAGHVVSDHPVRSLDAIHLATAVIASRHARRHGARLTFCTADRRQATAAEAIFGATQVILVPPPA